MELWMRTETLLCLFVLNLIYVNVTWRVRLTRKKRKSCTQFTTGAFCCLRKFINTHTILLWFWNFTFYSLPFFLSFSLWKPMFILCFWCYCCFRLFIFLFAATTAAASLVLFNVTHSLCNFTWMARARVSSPNYGSVFVAFVATFFVHFLCDFWTPRGKFPFNYLSLFSFNFCFCRWFSAACCCCHFFFFVCTLTQTSHEKMK